MFFLANLLDFSTNGLKAKYPGHFCVTKHFQEFLLNMQYVERENYPLGPMLSVGLVLTAVYHNLKYGPQPHVGPATDISHFIIN